MPKPANPIPDGFHSVTPHITIKAGAAAYIDFLKRAFNAVEIDRSPGPGGKLMHALVRIGDSMLMMNDDFSREFHLPPVAEGNLPFVFNYYSTDADAVWKQAVDAGCTVAMPIADQFWGDRYGLLADPFGFKWAVASRKEDLTQEERQARAARVFGGGQS